MIRTIDNTLKIKSATLTVTDENGSIMNIEIDTDELGITNYIEESDDPWPMLGWNMSPRHIGSRFTLHTERQYVVSYSQKERA